jgi:preprotein translocase subunit SecF
MAGASTAGGKTAVQQRFTTIVPEGTAIDFVNLMKIAVPLSTLAVLAVAVLWVYRGGPNYGIDFAGGTMLHVRFTESRSPGDVRELLAGAGRADAEILEVAGGANEFFFRLPSGDTPNENAAGVTVAALKQSLGETSFEVLRSEMVGPKVGRDLRRKALWAVLASTIVMGIYVALRFELAFGIGAAVALVHDVAVSLGGLLLLNYEFDLSVVAALLTVVGFSVNDTVIVSDRIRENMHKMRHASLVEIANRSINETLSRTIITSGTALFVIIALFLLGGSVIHGFAFTLLVGFTAGVYSTVFVATQIVLAIGARRGKLRSA